ncbi:MAG: hypothetical protein ABL986_12205 [Vicinamibacterales bacterium]
MTGRETRRYEMLQRVSVFGEHHRESFPEAGPVRNAFDTISEVVQQIGAHAMVHHSTAREGKGKKDAARAALEAQIAVIWRCAQLMGRDRPELSDSFHLRRPRSDRAVLIAGQLFSRQVAGKEQEFVNLGMPEDFHVQLNELITAYEDALQAWKSSRTTRRTARLNLDVVFSRSSRAIQTLDVVVPNCFWNDRATLAVWERDRRVEYPRVGRRRKQVRSGKFEVRSGSEMAEVRRTSNQQPATRN